MKSNSLSWSQKSDVNSLAHVLSEGGCALGTTDTVIGLFACATKEGYLQLNTIKKRSEKPYVVLIDSKEKLYPTLLSPLSIHMEKLISAWPGPLTLIFAVKPSVFPDVARDGTIAFRIPKHQGMLDLLAQTGPLFSTSANISGQPVPTSLDDVDPSITEKVAAIIDGGSITMQPSTMLDCTTDVIKVVRSGAYDITLLEHIAGVHFLRNS